MCYYENFRYCCGDWKWGNFRVHCQKEYRMGETCGMKMVHSTTPLADKCSMCEKIERKKRRYEKAQSDYSRWVKDPQRQASMAKAYDDMKGLHEEIEKLIKEKEARYKMIGTLLSSLPLCYRAALVSETDMHVFFCCRSSGLRLKRSARAFRQLTAGCQVQAEGFIRDFWLAYVFAATRDGVSLCLLPLASALFGVFSLGREGAFR